MNWSPHISSLGIILSWKFTYSPIDTIIAQEEVITCVALHRLYRVPTRRTTKGTHNNSAQLRRDTWAEFPTPNTFRPVRALMVFYFIDIMTLQFLKVFITIGPMIIKLELFEFLFLYKMSSLVLHSSTPSGWCICICIFCILMCSITMNVLYH